MVNPQITSNTANRVNVSDPIQVALTFQKTVIDRFQISIGNRSYTYQEYLNLPTPERRNDEADAVDQRFARAVLEWLGFEEGDWNYNRPQEGQKANRPDYVLRSGVGTAFIWEDKNSTLDVDNEHLLQMQRYCDGTAGYAVWCNMRRLLAVRFIPSDILKYEMLVDVAVEELLREKKDVQATNLALFRLLFGKERFTQFAQLLANICVDEQSFVSQTIPLDKPGSTQQFIAGSRQSLEHLRLAALAQIREAIDQRNQLVKEDVNLRREWETARDEFIGKIRFSASGLDVLSQRVLAAIDELTPRLGEISAHDIRKVKLAIEKTVGKKLSAGVCLIRPVGVGAF